MPIPSRFRPPSPLPNLGSWSNRLLWRLGTAAMNGGWPREINRVRRRAGLAELVDPAGDGLYAPALNLVAASPRLTPPPPDWAPRHRVTGYWFLDPAPQAPPPAVAEFVCREPRPILISFGTMVATPRPDLVRLLSEAVASSGVRAVVELGGDGGAGADLPPTILPVDGSVPHAWLMPRVAAVVHHGGAGIAGATFRAGVPSVFVPHFFEQQLWAATAAKLGVAPPPIRRRDLTSARLARAISVAVGDQRLRGRAMELGAAVRREDGVGTAVRLVEEYIHG
jgi:sterol 3beta-glucosyltransferase